MGPKSPPALILRRPDAVRRVLSRAARCSGINRVIASYGWKRIDILMESSGAEWKHNDNLLIPYAH